MQRRQFIKTSVLGGIALGTMSIWHKTQAQSNSKYAKKLVILHTNDVHSHIDAFSKNHPKFPGMGGFARRAALINKVRQEEKNVLLLDCGDIFQGTPYFNFFNGELEFKLMSKMGYDAATFGNHEFDNGIECINNNLPFAKFPFVCSNYDFSQTILKDKTKPHIVKEIDGLRVGIMGLGIDFEGLVSEKNKGKAIYNNALDVARQKEKELKEKENCDLIIAISHLGLEYENEKISDIKIAKETNDIDIIIGGHTHTFLEQPRIEKNLKDKTVVINQVGWAGVWLGRIDVGFNPITGSNEAFIFTTKVLKKQ